MTVCALTDPDIHHDDIDSLLSWSRLMDQHVGPHELIRGARELFRRGLSNREAAHLMYELGGVINVSQLYPDPKDRFAIRNFTLDAVLTWFERDFKPTESFPPKTIGKFYAGFGHVGARLPKKIHQFLRDKVREQADAFLPKDGARVIEYYATTGDHISASVFEVAVKAVERDASAMMKSPQVAFLNNMAIIDALYGEAHFTKGYEPRTLFFRNLGEFADSNLAVRSGRVDTAKQWFKGEGLTLGGNGLRHIRYVQHTAKVLGALGFDVHSDFNSSATTNDTNGIDFSVSKPSSDRRVGVIYDTSVKYVEVNTLPRSLVPSGRMIFNSAALQKLHPDSVIVRLSTIAMNNFETAVIGRAFEDAFRAPANVYGLDERAQLQPIRKLSFKS